MLLGTAPPQNRWQTCPYERYRPAPQEFERQKRAHLWLPQAVAPYKGDLPFMIHGIHPRGRTSFSGNPNSGKYSGVARKSKYRSKCS